MASIALRAGIALKTLERLHVPRLRLGPDAGVEIEPTGRNPEPIRQTTGDRSGPGPGQDESPESATPIRGGAPPVLVAGRDSARRAILLDELSRTMPESTKFEEASAFSEVLEHAPGSRMVILSGDLADVSAESFTRTLGRRHPRLPVVRLDAPAPDDDLCARA